MKTSARGSFREDSGARVPFQLKDLGAVLYIRVSPSGVSLHHLRFLDIRFSILPSPDSLVHNAV